MQEIYLDYNASTPVHPRVSQAITNFLSSISGNPSSVHAAGRKARGELIASRDAIARYLNVQSEEIVFTSGGTEGINLALFGFAKGKAPGRILSTKLEHAAVWDALKELQRQGWQIDWIECKERGHPTKEQVEEAITFETKLIVLMAANNETGVKTPIDEIASVAKKRGIPLIVDAIALFGKEPVSIPRGVSSMIFSGQKFYAPKGCGFIYVSKDFPLKPLFFGGGQEKGRRAGTENMIGIIAMREAILYLQEALPILQEKMRRQRDHFEKSLAEKLQVAVNGEGPRVANTSNLCFEGVDGESLLMILDQSGVFASHGSACATGALEPSRVLLEMGYPRKRAMSSLRFSIGAFTTDEEIDRAINLIVSSCNKLVHL